ncbi:MAG TPA: hypothetical protein ENN69_02105, partial [Spirochaetia bacterium]|nr:hypothetical protein [Spirochaetia bacterium]
MTTPCAPCPSPGKKCMQIHEEHIIPALDDFAERAADFLVERIRRAVRDGRPCSVILAGGTTPRPVYAGLSRRLGALPAGLGTLSFFIGDERVVAPESPERNERMIREAFGAFFDETHKRLYPWEPPPLSAPAAAARYERTLAGYFQGPRAKPDLAVLGLGADGHTASLFPNAVVLRRTKETEPVGPTLPGRAVA